MTPPAAIGAGRRNGAADRDGTVLLVARIAVALITALVVFGRPAAALAQEPAANAGAADGSDLGDRVERLVEQQLKARLPGGQADAAAEVLPSGVPFLVRFSRGAEGLRPGVPVRILGMRTGTVREVAVVYDRAAGRFAVPVVFDLVPDRLVVDGESPKGDEATYDLVAELVSRGLRARLQGGDLLSGPVHLALDVFPDAPAAALGRGGAYPQIPAVPTRAEELTAVLEDLLAKLRALPLDALVGEAEATLASFRALITGEEVRLALDNLVSSTAQLEQFAGRIGTQMAPLLNNLVETTDGVRQTVDEARKTVAGAGRTLERATETVVSLDRAVGARAPLWSDVQRLVRELTAASRALRLFAETLERNPEALIRGKEGGR